MSDHRSSPLVAQSINVDGSGPALDRPLYAAFNQRNLTGEQPHVAASTVFARSELDLNSLVPADMSVAGSCHREHFKVLLAGNSEASLLIEQQFRASVEIAASASSAEVAKALVDNVKSQIPVKTATRGQIPVAVWHAGSRGPTHNIKRIGAPTWRAIKRNYPSSVSTPLDELMKAKRPNGKGRLILWHGEPGTGKTTALRALMRSWQGWCSAGYVADPEKMFASTEYLLHVVGRGALGQSKRWRLLIAEDSDEFLRTSARKEAGAALGRLLNMSDGILGQGSQVIILLTTNEHLDRIHPALVRPGRCMAQVEFQKFSPSEANHWLSHGVRRPTSPVSLAELIEIERPRPDH